MLSLLIYAAVGTSATTPDEACARFTNYIKAHPYLGVDFIANGNVRGNLVVKQPKQFRLEFKKAGVDYVMIRNGDAGVEFDRFLTLFSPALFGEKLADYESLFSEYPSAMAPRMIMNGRLKQIFESLPLKVVSETGGVTKIEAGNQKGHNYGSFAVDTQGHLLQYHTHSESPMGTVDLAFTFSNYRISPPTSFDIRPPMGYFSFGIPDFVYPLQKGQPLHLGTWVDSRGIRVAADNLVKSGRTIVAILDPAQEPSKRASAHLAELNAALKGSTKVIVLTTKQIGHTGDGPVAVLTDPSGANIRLVLATGAPLYYLVENGKVVRIWMGDDESTRSATFRDIASAASGK